MVKYLYESELEGIQSTTTTIEEHMSEQCDIISSI